MSEIQEACLNCNRTEAQVPLIAWRYQGQMLWVCSECTPYLIHHTEVILAKWQAQNISPTTERGD